MTGTDQLTPVGTDGGLTVLARGQWPPAGRTDQAGQPEPPPAVPGFIISAFSPLATAAAEQCLRQRYDQPPADPRRGRDTAIVICSVLGDPVTAAAVAQAVDAGRRVPPLLFYQAVPNSVAGHIAARWGLAGPVVCLSPAGDPIAEAMAVAELLIADRAADEVLMVAVELAVSVDGQDTATALLIGADRQPLVDAGRQPLIGAGRQPLVDAGTLADAGRQPRRPPGSAARQNAVAEQNAEGESR